MKKTLIERVDVGAGGAASITFSSIPQTYDGLYLLVSARISRAGSTSTILALRFNGDTGTNYAWRLLNGDGASAASYSSSSTSLASAGYASGPSATASTFSNHGILIPNYTSSSAKSISTDSVTENNATTVTLNLSASSWSGTAAISSLTLAELSGPSDFVQYSSASLYGITAGSDGTTTVS